MENAATAIELKKKDKVSGRVVKTTLAGAIVDIGHEYLGVLHISQLAEGHVNRVEDALQVGQEIEAWVRRVDERAKRVELTMVEPLLLEWKDIKKGMTVSGKVTKLEKYGVFIEIGSERPGLAHISELTHEYIRQVSDVVKVGDQVQAMVLDVDRRRKQIKLSLKALLAEPAPEVEEEEVADQPAPTAMEVALRRAMSQSPATPETTLAAETKPESKTGKQKKQLDDIITRTLERKPQGK